MDYLEGVSLEQLIVTSPKPDIPRLIRIFIQVGNALSHAHEQGVVHRDIKPGNIIVSKNGEGLERAMLVDFGIAKILPRADGIGSKLTQTGDVFGTPLYMSPEQCQGQPVDARTDIYALGCVMYEALTGAPPFQGESLYHTIHMQLCDAPPPFPKELRTPIGRKLEAIVLKALAKAQHSRYRFMLDLVGELKRVELISNGPIDELKTLLAIMSGRMRALPRSTVLLRSALQLLTFLALITAGLIFALPPQIAEATRQAEKYGAVLIIVNRMTDTEDPTARMFKDEPIEETPYIDRLDLLCADNAEELQIVAHIRRSSAAAQALSMKALDKLDSGLASLLGFRQNNRKLAQTGLKSIVLNWSEATRWTSELHALSYNRYVKHKGLLDAFMTLFNVSKWAGIGIELALLGLFAQRWYDKRQSASSKNLENLAPVSSTKQ